MCPRLLKRDKALPVLVDLDSKGQGTKEANFLILALKKSIGQLPALLGPLQLLQSILCP